MCFYAIAGAYVHPKTVADTLDFIRRFGSIDSTDFNVNSFFLPTSRASKPLARLLKRLTYGTVCSGNSIRLYRSGGAMLSSIDSFWPGLVGGQAVPWMAVADTVPVWTQSGLVTEKWLDRDGDATNTHLPLIVQDGNMAMIMYKPERPMPLEIWGRVALNWPEASFDETRTVISTVVNDDLRGSLSFTSLFESLLGSSRDSAETAGSWILGRKGESYVAVFRPCGENMEKGWYACSGAAGRQLWAVVVGDQTRYGSFDSFAAVIAGSVVQASYRRRRLLQDPVYTTSLMLEGKRIQKEW